jgi:hypothetical protein
MSKTRILITATVFAFAPFIFSQDVPDGASPVLPADIVGPQLIMWSELQKPQPVPQPLPPPEKADQQQSEPATGSQAQGQPTAQIFTGTIVKDGDKYILKASGGTAYQVDDQEKAKHYEGKQVKVTGSLDKSNVLHISGIELLS